jgi:DNA invertase Pin-like site-specific DNA recombinase
MSVAPAALPTKGSARASNSPQPIAVTYLRVSTKEQAEMGGYAEGLSIPTQRAAVQRQAEKIDAIIVEEFTDAGESARSADRPELQRMLAYLANNPVDYVIVHKIDRLARNRLDDLSISLAMEDAGVQLISCTENIDKSPAGKLTHGLMALIAEWYSSNLSQEVKTKTMEKVKQGGTVNKVPLGYLNVRQLTEGREVRTVAVDEVRGPLVVWAFESFATGEWSLSAITEALQAEGMTTLPSARMAEKPIPRSTVHRMLRNPYYTGVVMRNGARYPGIHEPLISNDTFEKVQAVLDAHNVAGDRVRVHDHYLKGSVFCRECGGRLCITKTKNRHGTEYLYFFCLANYRRRTVCHQKAISVELVEAHIEDKWAHVQLEPEYASLLRELIESELEASRGENKKIGVRAARRLASLNEEKEKLLRAHYADAVPLDLLKKEQTRIAGEIQAVERKLASADANFDNIKDLLERCLDLLANCHDAYLASPPSIRRMMNQAVFEKFLVDLDGSTEAIPTDMFGVLLRQDFVLPSGQPNINLVDDEVVHRNSDWANGRPVNLSKGNGENKMRAPERRGARTCLGHLQKVGLNKILLAEGVGFEPTEACTSRRFKYAFIGPVGTAECL